MKRQWQIGASQGHSCGKGSRCISRGYRRDSDKCFIIYYQGKITNKHCGVTAAEQRYINSKIRLRNGKESETRESEGDSCIIDNSASHIFDALNPVGCDAKVH